MICAHQISLHEFVSHIVRIFYVNLTANGISVLANISNQTGQHGNNIQLIPVIGNSNKSEIHNVTSNTINQETTINSANGTTLLTRNTSTAGSIIDVLMGYDVNAKNATNLINGSTVSTSPHNQTSTTPSSMRTSTIITIGGNNTTTSPSHHIKRHHSKSYVLHYILIPIGCFAVTFVISFFLVSYNLSFNYYLQQFFSEAESSVQKFESISHCLLHHESLKNLVIYFMKLLENGLSCGRSC